MRDLPVSSPAFLPGPGCWQAHDGPCSIPLPAAHREQCAWGQAALCGSAGGHPQHGFAFPLHNVSDQGPELFTAWLAVGIEFPWAVCVPRCPAPSGQWVAQSIRHAPEPCTRRLVTSCCPAVCPSVAFLLFKQLSADLHWFPSTFVLR